jgi:hypothetical protein
MIGRNSVTEQTGPGYPDSGKSSGGSAGRHRRVTSSRSTSGVARTSFALLLEVAALPLEEA